MSLPTVDECDYSTTTDRKGRFIGRVKQFPNLRSKACRSRVDAIAEIVDQTAIHIRYLHGASEVTT